MASASENKRAYRYRVRLRAGDTLSPDQAEWLRDYESRVPPGDRVSDVAVHDAQGTAPPEHGTESALPADAAPTDTPQATAPVAPPTPPAPPPTARGMAPPPPPPPRTRAGMGGGPDWRAKYGAAGDSPDIGREHICVYLGDKWLAVLTDMHDAIVESGGKPITGDVKDMRNALILAVDSVLPQEAKVSPQLFAAGATSALLTQAFLRRKEIKSAREMQRMRQARTNLYSVPMSGSEAAKEPGSAATPSEPLKPATQAPVTVAAPAVIPIAQSESPAVVQPGPSAMSFVESGHDE